MFNLKEERSGTCALIEVLSYYEVSGRFSCSHANGIINTKHSSRGYLMEIKTEEQLVSSCLLLTTQDNHINQPQPDFKLNDMRSFSTPALQSVGGVLPVAWSLLIFDVWVLASGMAGFATTNKNKTHCKACPQRRKNWILLHSVKILGHNKLPQIRGWQ